MNQAELQILVEKISIEFFSIPFSHQAFFNSRLRTTGGRYLLQSHHLEFNPRVWNLYGEEELIGVIKHELCHYHLHLANKGYQHKDLDFKQLLAQTGGSRFVNNLRTKAEEKKYLVYLCSECSQVYHRKKRIDINKYVCGKCKGKLIHQK